MNRSNSVGVGSEAGKSPDLSLVPAGSNPSPVQQSSGAVYRSSKHHQVHHRSEKSLLTACFITLIFLFLAIILLMPCVCLLVPLYVCAYLLRWMLAQCCCWQHDYLTPQQLRWLHSHVPYVILLGFEDSSEASSANGLTLERLKDLVKTRILEAQFQEKPAYPRFSQSVVAIASGYVWRKDEYFKMENHLYLLENAASSVEEVLSSLEKKPLNWNRPLWDMHLVCMKGSREKWLVVRLHPAVSDGLTLVHLFTSALCDEQAVLRLEHRYGASEKSVNYLRTLFLGPLVCLQKWLFLRRDHNVAHPRPRYYRQQGIEYGCNVGPYFRKTNPETQQTLPHTPPGRQLRWQTYDLRSVSHIKQVTHTTYNDLYLSVVAGAMRSYQQFCGVTHPFDCLTLVPVDATTTKQAESAALGHPTSAFSSRCNNFTLVDVCLPVNTEGVVPRLWQVKLRMDEMKHSADRTILHAFQQWAHGSLPLSWANSCISAFHSKCTSVTANLQGPEMALHLDQHEVKHLVAWFPPVAHAGITCTFVTYSDKLYMAVSAPDLLVAQVEYLVLALTRQLDILSKMMINRLPPTDTSDSNSDSTAHRTKTSRNSSHVTDNNHNEEAAEHPSTEISSVTTQLSSTDDMAQTENGRMLIFGAGTRPQKQNYKLRRAAALLSGGVAVHHDLSKDTEDDIHEKLAHVQGRLEDAQHSPTENVEMLRQEFHSLVHELRRRKRKRSKPQDSDDEEEDEEQEVVYQNEGDEEATTAGSSSQSKRHSVTRRISLTNFAEVARLKAIGTSLTRPIESNIFRDSTRKMSTDPFENHNQLAAVNQQFAALQHYGNFHTVSCATPPPLPPVSEMNGVTTPPRPIPLPTHNGISRSQSPLTSTVSLQRMSNSEQNVSDNANGLAIVEVNP